eukprot:gene27718-7363_t
MHPSTKRQSHLHKDPEDHLASPPLIFNIHCCLQLRQHFSLPKGLAGSSTSVSGARARASSAPVAIVPIAHVALALGEQGSDDD